jgi:hypothetical protein
MQNLPAHINTAAWVCLAGSMALLAGGCAPRTSWRSSDRRLCSGDLCYRLGALAPGWRVVRTSGAQIDFFNETLDAAIQGNATCRGDNDTSPLGALTANLLLGYTERRTRSQETIPLAGREALETIVEAKLDGVPLLLDVVVLKRNNCIFDLSFVVPLNAGAPRAEATRSAEFPRFVAGFADERRP